jgi:hypothetical protein
VEQRKSPEEEAIYEAEAHRLQEKNIQQFEQMRRVKRRGIQVQAAY